MPNAPGEQSHLLGITALDNLGKYKKESKTTHSVHVQSMGYRIELESLGMELKAVDR